MSVYNFIARLSTYDTRFYPVCAEIHNLPLSHSNFSTSTKTATATMSRILLFTYYLFPTCIVNCL